MANHLKENQFSTLIKPPSHLSSLGTVVVGVVSGEGGGGGGTVPVTAGLCYCSITMVMLLLIGMHRSTMEAAACIPLAYGWVVFGPNVVLAEAILRVVVLMVACLFLMMAMRWLTS